MGKGTFALALFSLFAGAQDTPRKSRYESFTEKAAKGPKMKAVAATFFGGPGIEEFIAVRVLPSGTVAAFGNAWGREFPGSPTVLGKGEHRGLKATVTDSKGRTSLRPDNPDIAGMVVLFAPDLSKIEAVVRFDWGVASLSAATATADGKALLLAGRSTAAFRGVPKKVQSLPEPPAPETPAGKKAPPKNTGPYDYEGVTCPGDVFVARFSLESGLEWAWVFEGYRTAPEQLWLDTAGNIYADVRGMTQISPDGATAKRLTPVTAGRQAQFLAIDPADGASFYGGDRNTNTGKEPWRQPYLYKFDTKGERVWKIWEWPSKSLRDGTTEGLQGLVADSSARAMDVATNGDLFVGCWSDGGNSVLNRQPTDAKKAVPGAPFKMDCWGMKGANSLAHIVRIDGKTLEAKTHALWVAYFPGNFEDPQKRGSPNGARIRQIKALPNGAVAVAGSAASVLVQTPGAFYTYPGDGRGYGGECVVVFDADFSNLLFSSYLPGCEDSTLWPTPKGIAVVSRSRGTDGQKDPTKTPVIKALQSERQGEFDAHILLLEMP